MCFSIKAFIIRNKVEIDNWELTVLDPSEIARLSGIVKYKLLGLISPKDVDLEKRQKNEYKEYERELKEKNTIQSIINPWDTRVLSQIKDKEYVYNNLLINGQNINTLKEYILKRNYYFMLGDNRDNSSDSRFWGFVPDNLILGTPVYSFVNIANFKLRMNVVN